ncbi:MAG: hypothetical protein WDM90_04020 [Ferruginibacter sp.]
MIQQQLNFYGATLREQIIPTLLENNICLVYNQPVPDAIVNITNDYFIMCLPPTLK